MPFYSTGKINLLVTSTAKIKLEIIYTYNMVKQLLTFYYNIFRD